PRPVVEDQLGLAMEPISSPIGRHIATVAPDRAHLHPTQRLPDGLAALNGPLGCDHLAVARHDSLWDRRHFLVDAAADPAQDCEAENHDDCQYNPESLHARLLSVRGTPGRAPSSPSKPISL